MDNILTPWAPVGAKKKKAVIKWKFACSLFRYFCFEIIFEYVFKNVKNYLKSKIEKLHSTYDGKSSKKSHSSSDEWKHVNKLNFFILSDSIKGCGIKINLDKSKLEVRLKILINIDICKCVLQIFLPLYPSIKT